METKRKRARARSAGAAATPGAKREQKEISFDDAFELFTTIFPYHGDSDARDDFANNVLPKINYLLRHYRGGQKKALQLTPGEFQRAVMAMKKWFKDSHWGQKPEAEWSVVVYDNRTPQVFERSMQSHAAEGQSAQLDIARAVSESVDRSEPESPPPPFPKLDSPKIKGMPRGMDSVRKILGFDRKTLNLENSRQIITGLNQLFEMLKSQGKFDGRVTFESFLRSHLFEHKDYILSFWDTENKQWLPNLNSTEAMTDEELGTIIDTMNVDRSPQSSPDIRRVEDIKMELSPGRERRKRSRSRDRKVSPMVRRLEAAKTEAEAQDARLKELETAAAAREARLKELETAAAAQEALLKEQETKLKELETAAAQEARLIEHKEEETSNIEDMPPKRYQHPVTKHFITEEEWNELERKRKEENAAIVQLHHVQTPGGAAADTGGPPPPTQTAGVNQDKQRKAQIEATAGGPDPKTGRVAGDWRYRPVLHKDTRGNRFMPEYEKRALWPVYTRYMGRKDPYAVFEKYTLKDPHRTKCANLLQKIAIENYLHPMYSNTLFRDKIAEAIINA